MDELDIPQYFLCPISLQIMKDPVTTVSGITYDRESIEQWILTAAADGHSSAMCPVTKQLLPRSSDLTLTPNHMVRRLIQAWCIANAKSGIERIPTPKYPVQKSVVFKLIRDVKSGNPLLQLNALKKLDEFARDKEVNKKSMSEAGVAKATIFLILKRYKEGKTLFLEEALRILHLTWIPTEENKKIVEENFDFMHSLSWVLSSNEIENISKIHALKMLKIVTEVAKISLLERLKLDFFKEMVSLLHKNISPPANKAVLHVLIQTSPFGRNRMKIVEAGAVFEIIELELKNPDKKTTELIFCLLANLCTCADGRQQLLKHAGGIAMAAKRLLRISPATDDRALSMIESIARFSATREVVSEMLRVNVVSKLCMVLQADCTGYLKNKARDILRLHNYAWSNSPCVQVYLLTWYTR